ncbi:hypothetical protein RFI_25341 [Reticulomyxa filosa]|uniref:Transmembrane protein n=1 Tax=Reticulomyxa filosa TaxID=46433 RepID=X6MED8_RETFI|nr:hypothetical protein RFI_25341 [Reticulomyxa filosa]|eukprot:ETO12036.1 hypothetical protein RFI_25341 [Reticulomyxa filosa]
MKIWTSNKKLFDLFFLLTRKIFFDHFQFAILLVRCCFVSLKKKFKKYCQIWIFDCIKISLCQMNIDSLFTKPKKSSSKLIELLSMIKMASGLVEDIFAIYYQSKGDHEIFWIMYGFGVAVGIVEAFSMLNCFVEVIAIAALESAQAVLFMWTSDWDVHSIIFFGAIGGGKIILQWVESWYEESHEEEKGNTALEKVSTCAQVCIKCYLPIFLGLTTLPYLYFNKDSYFRTDWFDVCITVTLWLAGVMFEYHGKLMRKLLQSGELEYSIAYVIVWFLNTIWTIGFAVLTYVLCILIVKDRSWANLYEKIFTIAIVAGYSTSVCLCCCQLLYLAFRVTRDNEF